MPRRRPIVVSGNFRLEVIALLAFAFVSPGTLVAKVIAASRGSG